MWESVRAAFGAFAESPVVRMIDDLPAFPDERPEAGWRELRISLSGGMVTVRDVPAGWECVIWGNADESLRRAWNIACWAIASAGQGRISLETGESAGPDEFRSTHLDSQ